ncbi:hypothetical protein B0O80DRAFT_210142 [Mortierella sp. GBAus27b]|nr:hypothetical protein B0O80DRAFT_210142 [Mortierella sp. GBAus27b]
MWVLRLSHSAGVLRILVHVLGVSFSLPCIERLRRSYGRIVVHSAMAAVERSLDRALCVTIRTIVVEKVEMDGHCTYILDSKPASRPNRHCNRKRSQLSGPLFSFEGSFE